MKVSLKNGDISTVSSEEIEAYKKYVTEKYPDEVIDEIILEFEGEDVKIETHKHSAPFSRIRRITGYLVGTMDRWNNGKKAEERDRVKHGVTEE
jgi:anaerobic ribonucleoside-triphosphate reductase